jgi:hypothetical protein
VTLDAAALMQKRRRITLPWFAGARGLFALSGYSRTKDKAFEYLEKSYQLKELWIAYLQAIAKHSPSIH